MVTHSSTLAWEIPWTEEPGGLQSMRLQESDTKPPPPTHFECKLRLLLVLRLPTTPELSTTTVLSLGPQYLCSKLLLFIAKARILEWVAISFSRGSSPSWGGAHVSCWAGRFFTTVPSKLLWVYIYSLSCGMWAQLPHKNVGS